MGPSPATQELLEPLSSRPEALSPDPSTTDQPSQDFGDPEGLCSHPTILACTLDFWRPLQGVPSDGRQSPHRKDKWEGEGRAETFIRL